MPGPLEIKGGAAPEKRPATGTGKASSGSKKKAPNKKMGFFEGHIQALLDKKKKNPT